GDNRSPKRPQCPNGQPDVRFAKVLVGEASTGFITGVKWYDLNGNGVLDPGEPGLGGWTVYVDVNDNGVLDEGEPSATTFANGAYTIINVPFGTYHVREVLKDGWAQTFPAEGVHTVTLDVDNFLATGINFGNSSGTISGVKFKDLNGNGVQDPGEPGLAGWTVFVDLNENGVLDPGEPFAVTSASGAYTIANLPFGTYQVREVLQDGWTQTAPADGLYTLTLELSNPIATGVNFGNTIGAGRGRVWTDPTAVRLLPVSESPPAGWTVYLDLNNNGVLDPGEPFAVTAANGTYTIGDIPLGTYTVREVPKDGWVQ